MINIHIKLVSGCRLEQATRTLAVELAPHGIRVNAVSPGFTFSGMNVALQGDKAFMEQMRRDYLIPNETTERSRATVKKTPSLDIRTLRRRSVGREANGLYGRETGGSVARLSHLLRLSRRSRWWSYIPGLHPALPSTPSRISIQEKNPLSCIEIAGLALKSHTPFSAIISLIASLTYTVRGILIGCA